MALNSIMSEDTLEHSIKTTYQKENKLVFIIRTCLIDELVKCLFPRIFINDHKCKDLLNLMLSCKDIKKILFDKFIGIHEFNLSSIKAIQFYLICNSSI